MKRATFLTIATFSIILATGAQFARAADANPSPAASPSPKASSSSSGQGVDDMITNNELRALSGSLSRWSFASTWDYLGGTIFNPLEEDRPDISGASGTTAKADLDGSISVKYNLDKDGKNSLSGGVGLRWIAPLVWGGPHNYNGNTFDVLNPFVQYQYIFKFWGIQSIIQPQVTLWTQTDFTAFGYNWQFQVDWENMYAIGKTGLSFGISSVIQWQTFNKSGQVTTPDGTTYPDIGVTQSQFLIQIAPILEYQLTEKLNLRTLISPLTYEHYITDTQTWEHDGIYQSFGVGWSVTRDIFLYPNFQYIVTQPQANLTNVGLMAIINLF